MHIKGLFHAFAINVPSSGNVPVAFFVEPLGKNDFVQFKQLTHDQYYSNILQEQTDNLPDDWVKELYNNTEENYSLSIPGSTPAINYFASGVHNKQKAVLPDNGSELAGARINTDFKIPDRVKIGEQLNVWKRNTTPVKADKVSTPFRTVPAGSPYTGNPDAPWGGFSDYQADLSPDQTCKF